MKKDKNSKLFEWVGGKTWLGEELRNINNTILNNNKNIEYYIEPFVGSMGSFLEVFSILKENGITNFILNDINSSIIYTYEEIKKDYKSLFNEYYKIEKEFHKLIPGDAFSLHKTKDKDFLKLFLQPAYSFYLSKRFEYNELRKEKNKYKHRISVLFLFLQKHCFNGIYRENFKGEMNTSFDWSCYHLNFLDEKLKVFENFSKIFNENNFIFYNEDVNFIIDKYKNKNALWYFDPPYLTNNALIKENKYNEKEFDLAQQLKLIDNIKSLDNVIYSNHDLVILEDELIKDNFEIKKVLRNNNVAGKVENRKNKISEILAYKTKGI